MFSLHMTFVFCRKKNKENMKRKRRKVERKDKKRNVKEERKEGRSSTL